MNRYALIALLAACGNATLDKPAGGDDGGADDGPGATDDPACQLTAITPAIAATGDTIYLDGTFGASVAVSFPGGAMVDATVLGSHRAKVMVPATATAGDLAVATCGATVGPLAFRRASFALGLAKVAHGPDQVSGARQATRLAVPRDGHTAEAIGDYLYVVGGHTRTGAIASVERALINADGTLGALRVLSEVALVTPRQGHTTHRIRDRLYVVGGYQDAPLASVEHAAITDDGVVGAFATDPAALVTARHGHASVVIGSYLYVLGGVAAGTLNTVERAAIRGDGSLGPFVALRDLALGTARHGHAAKVIGNYLYVIGGAGADGVLATVERAEIEGDGSIGAFAAAPGASLRTARSDFTTLMIGGALYVLGGSAATGAVSSIERAPIGDDGALGAFAATPSGLGLQRYGYAVAIAGNTLHVIGGSDDVGTLQTDEQASLDVSGSLGAFGLVSGVALNSERAHCRGVVLGRWFYVIGGGIDPTSVERAPVLADGSLGPFSPVAGVHLANGRDGHTLAVIGDHLYVLGGSRTVERSPIGPDGSLGAFEVAGTLISARLAPSAVVAGHYLYIIGGTSEPDSATTNTERAAINPDGSLGTFATVASTSATARYFPTTVATGGYIYVFGGSDPVAGGDTTSVIRANDGVSDGLGDFEAAPGPAQAALGPVAAMLGSAAYAFGYNTVVQRAAIDPVSGELGAFTTQAITLAPSRFAPASTVIANYVYVVGGAAGRALLKSAVRAELQ